MSFDKCFDERKIKEFKDKIPKIYEEIEKLTKREIKPFPKKIKCMTVDEIFEGTLRGGGHGIYQPPDKIKINPFMSLKGIALNFVHENLHHALPDLNEKVIDILTHHVGCKTELLEDEICDFFKEVE